MQDGSLGWKPLLPAETINESIVARATANNPKGAKKLQELEEIRSMHVELCATCAVLTTAASRSSYSCALFASRMNASNVTT